MELSPYGQDIQGGRGSSSSSLAVRLFFEQATKRTRGGLRTAALWGAAHPSVPKPSHL